MTYGTQAMLIIATLIAVAVAYRVTNTAAKKPSGVISYGGQQAPTYYGPQGEPLGPNGQILVAQPTPTTDKNQQSLPMVFLQMWLVVEVPLLLVIAILTKFNAGY